MDASEHGAQADNTLPCFGISEVADMTGISAFTIRYYDKCGFFPELARDARGVRTFSQSDVAQHATLCEPLLCFFKGIM